MISLITSAYSTYQSCTTKQTPKRVEKLVKDMESHLGKLSLEEQKEQVNRIQEIKATAKKNDIKNHMVQTGIQFVKLGVGKVTGPIGSAIVNYGTTDIDKNLSNKNESVIGKAKFVCGRRMRVRQKNMMGNKSSPLTTAAKTGIVGTALNASGLVNYASQTFWGSLNNIKRLWF